MAKEEEKNEKKKPLKLLLIILTILAVPGNIGTTTLKITPAYDGDYMEMTGVHRSSDQAPSQLLPPTPVNDATAYTCYLGSSSFLAAPDSTSVT
jgi:hypothetical protein